MSEEETNVPPSTIVIAKGDPATRNVYVQLVNQPLVVMNAVTAIRFRNLLDRAISEALPC